MSEDRKIAVDMAEKMVEERKMTEQMAAEISENCKYEIMMHFSFFIKWR